MSLTIKIREKIIEAWLKDRVEISKQQYGFMPEKKTRKNQEKRRMETRMLEICIGKKKDENK